MEIVKHALLLAVTSMLSLGIVGAAKAGTFSWSTDIDPSTGQPGWQRSTATGHDVWSLSCTAVAVATTMFDSATNGGYITLHLTYVGTATDTPPTTITLTYDASQTGQMQYAFLGRTPPSGSGSADYSGTVTRASGTPSTVSDFFGPVAQQTYYTGSTYAPHDADLSNQTLSTPVSGWTSTPGSGNVVTYTKSIKILDASGGADATCTVNWKSSNTVAGWVFEFDDTSFSVAHTP